MTVVFFLLLMPAFVLAQEVAATTSMVEGFESRYGVSVVWQQPEFPVAVTGGKITGNGSGQAGIRYLPLLVREFSVYPVAFIKRSQLKRIVVCKDLAFEGQHRAAIPDFAGNTLYLDCQRGQHSATYQRSVIHHEFFHLVDYRDDGLVYQDESWSALNRPNFKYGKGGRAVQNDLSQSAIRKPTAGFLTNYSMSGVEEDKAELFAHLIVNAKTVELAQASDEVLDSKVAQLKAGLRSFCEQLDAAFWQRVAAETAR